jgi:hypothetical protein
MKLAHLLLLGCFSVTGCAVTPSGEGENVAVDESEATASGVTKANVVASSTGVRRLELVDARGRKVATYYPGFFNATLLVPDVAGNTGNIIADRVRGTDVLSASLNPRTGMVAVAVRGFIYAETSSDMIFVLDTRSAAFAANPYRSPAFLPFDGRAADGTIATNAEPTRPFLDIQSVAYDAAGRIVVKTADASGGLGTIAYLPSFKATSCTWVGGEGRRCPAGL